MKRTLKQSVTGLILGLMLVGCQKSTTTPNGNNGNNGGNSGTVASFNTIPLPNASIANGIIPVLNEFYVTNRGVYVMMQNSSMLSRSFHKYNGGSGSAAWSKYEPDFFPVSFMPVNFTSEFDREFSIHWCNGAEGKYGMYNMNNGAPPFEYDVPTTPLGPGYFTKVASAKKGMHHLWGVAGQEIWSESVVVFPKTFDSIATIPGDLGSISCIFADPDDETVLWCGTQTGLYKVGTVSPNAGGDPGILQQWNLGSNGTFGVTAIIKTDGHLVFQFGNSIFELVAGQPKEIGSLIVSSGTSANICTDGTRIYASNGTYYNFNTKTWKSFIGDGVNLSQDQQTKYNLLKGYCSGAFPIGATTGGGPVYLLMLGELLSITPSTL
ncbi:hypothetical protein [Aurantibacillus circumpalustris]|uniref:hypothetical protein n=1 Tax=Aurantibacillus circumpalustris TaxID=3036359 RepID=UPI00295A7A8B|nr:hypothetical protein [Aurantibacillus circumpalustris]